MGVMVKKICSFRLSDKVKERLFNLSNEYGLSQAEIISLLILYMTDDINFVRIIENYCDLK